MKTTVVGLQYPRSNPGQVRGNHKKKRKRRRRRRRRKRKKRKKRKKKRRKRRRRRNSGLVVICLQFQHEEAEIFQHGRKIENAKLGLPIRPC